MLRKMRSGALSGFFMVFLLLGGFGLVLTDWGGFFSGGVSPRDIAEVNGEEIRYQSFNSQLEIFLRNRNIPRDVAYSSGLVDQVLRNRIEYHLLDQEGADLGLVIPDYLVAERIRPIIDMMGSGGVPRERALQTLASQNGQSVSQFLEDIRTEYIQQILYDTLKPAKQTVPALLSRQLYQYNNEIREISYVYLAHARIKDIEPPTAEDLKDFYESQKQNHTLPETRSFTLAVLSPEDIRDKISIDDSGLRAEYEENREDYEIAEKRSIEQAIVEEQETAEEIRTLVREGNMSLKDATREVTGDLKAYRKADSFDQNGLPQALSDVVFASSQVGKINDPVRTPLGWHVTKVTEIKPAGVQSFDEVRDEIRENLVRQQVDEIVIQRATEIDDALATGTGIDEIAKTYDMTQIDIGPVTESGNALDTPETPVKGLSFLEKYPEDQGYILENVFTTPVGSNAPVLELNDGSVVALQVSEVFPSRFKSFEDLEKTLTEKWMEKERIAENFEEARQYLEPLKAGELTLEKIAGNGKFDLKKNVSFQRNASVQEDTNFLEETRSRVFDQTIGSHFVAMADNGLILGKVNSVEVPDTKKIQEDEFSDLRTQHVAEIQSEMTGLYSQWLADQSKIDINRALLERRYGERTAGNL